MNTYKVKEKEISVLLKNNSDLNALQNILDTINSNKEDICDFYFIMLNSVLPNMLCDYGYSDNEDMSSPYLSDNSFDHLYPIKITFLVNKKDGELLRDIFCDFYYDVMCYSKKNVYTVLQFRKYVDNIVSSIKNDPLVRIKNI